MQRSESTADVRPDDPVAAEEVWRVRASGVVQGVGYRPFVYQVATGLGLGGWVLNDSQGVLTEVRGPIEQLAAFVTTLREHAPLLARVDEVVVMTCGRATAQDAGPFEIRPSIGPGPVATIVAPDSHVCEDCVREVLDPRDRRYRYPFTNCTHCGPRYSLISGLPYDRSQTTMAVFPMCALCQAEYTDSADRRYHAQPNACPNCGPRVTLSTGDGAVAESDDAVRAAVAALVAGRIVAVKSVGGFNLAANAQDPDAVALLRKRKRRDAKPFALMSPDLSRIAEFAWFDPAEAELLISPARPIVLLRKKRGVLPEQVAPRNPNLGVMLPSAPLHHLLLADPRADVLVMTSGNVSGDPIAYRNEDALGRLFDVADLVLHHDRDIETRVDDSVVRYTAHPELDAPVVSFLRRSRGYAPYPVKVRDAPAVSVLAYGAELKTTVALSHGDAIYLSQHIGDLKNDETFESHRQAAAHLSRLYGVHPSAVACDAHPAFRGTQFAEETTESEHLFLVQHHHAHMASCMAENQLAGTTVGVVFDGAGYGDDGTIWGGEFLLGDYREVRRVARLRAIPLLGGDKAVREPVRTAFVLALAAGPDTISAFPALARLDERSRSVFAKMVARGINTPPASSVGRLFDGVAALLGLWAVAEYEAQGPIELEGLLNRDLRMSPGYSFGECVVAGATEADYRPVIRAIAQDLGNGVPVMTISRRFHSAVVAMVVARCEAIRRDHGTAQIVLSGGVFLNEFLLVNCMVELRKAGFAPYCHRQVPANDGGIALGQAMVAGARMRANQAKVS